MKSKQLCKKLNLNDEAMQKIKDCVADVESKTTGEIAVAVAAESAHYSFWELLWADLIGAIVLIAMLPFSDKILGLYRLLYWQNEPSWILPVFYVISCFSTVVISFYLANIPAIDRIIIPLSVRKSCVTHRAFRYFTESGVYDTKEHSGILIFVSYLERQVRIIADSGIAEKIPQDLWNIIADDLAGGLKDGNTKDGFIAAVEKCGDLLAEHFPGGKDNPNELADGLVILGE